MIRENAAYQRALGDGREIVVYPRIYNSILVIGPQNDPVFYDTHW